MILLGLGLFLAGLTLGAIVEGRSRQREHDAALDTIEARIEALNQQLAEARAHAA